MILIKQMLPGNAGGWEYIPARYDNITRQAFLHDLMDNALEAKRDVTFEWDSTFEVYGVDTAEMAAGLETFTLKKPIRDRIDIVIPCVTLQWEKADDQEILWFDIFELAPDLERLMMIILKNHAKYPV